MNARCPTCNAELGDDSRCVACTLRLGVNADSNALASGFEAKPSDVPSPKQGLKGGEGPGDTLGVYRLIEVLGEGGMGHVWLAEQSTPLRRKVALKVIKPGLDSTQVLARFDAERQALALMDHPNIARVLDAGSTRNGRPYFVMEWVQGEPLTRFCDTRRLPIADRLRLVMAVCAAIQHAHQKGVIHRDIKPGNVLVTSLDGRSVPKVIDFGVAKAINQRLAERTLFTQLGAIVGTPEYMSPEQAELNDTDVDTRSDIYSLGVLLYEVLTGVVPLGPGASRRLPFDELLRQVREVDPPRPSAAVTQSGLDPAEVAARRGLESRTLAAALRGDLDWIVMRALEKDRSRRYPTANGLLLDLERYLAHEPVSARPPSGLYQLNKLVRRHRLAFAAAATTCLTLMIGLAVSAWSLHLERQARRRADRAESEQSSLRAAAEKAATRSREVADFLTRMLQGVGPAVAVGRDTALLREILDETSRSLREDLKAQPEVEADLSTTLSRVLTDLAEYPKAVEMARRAVALRPQATSIDGTASADRAASLRALARALAGAGELPESEATAREALDLLRRLGPESLPAVAESLAELGRILLLRDRPRSAETTFREAGALWERLGLPDDPRAADALHGLAQSIHAQGIERYADSLPVYQEALQATRRALGKHPQVADQLADYGMLLANQWKLSEGEVPIREALALRIELLGPTHPRVADTLYLLCDTLLKARKYDAADLEVGKLLPPGVGVTPEGVHLLRTRARVHARRGRFEAAADDFRKLLELEPGNHFDYLQLAPLLLEIGDEAGYLELYRRMVGTFLDTPDPNVANRVAKAGLLMPIPNVDQAPLDRWTGFALRELETHMFLPYAQHARGLFVLRQGRYSEAVEWMEKVLGNTGPSKAGLRDAQACAVLAMAQARLGALDEARESVRRAIEIRDSDPNADPEDLLSSWHDWLITELHIREAEAVIKECDAG